MYVYIYAVRLLHSHNGPALNAASGATSKVQKRDTLKRSKDKHAARSTLLGGAHATLYILFRPAARLTFAAVRCARGMKNWVSLLYIPDTVRSSVGVHVLWVRRRPLSEREKKANAAEQAGGYFWSPTCSYFSIRSVAHTLWCAPRKTNN